MEKSKEAKMKKILIPLLIPFIVGCSDPIPIPVPSEGTVKAIAENCSKFGKEVSYTHYHSGVSIECK